jgi:hypothetical protein
MAEKRKLTMAHYIIYGAIFCAMFAVVVGQNFIAGAEASSDITMNLVIAGAIVGAIGGGIFGNKKRSTEKAE